MDWLWQAVAAALLAGSAAASSPPAHAADPCPEPPARPEGTRIEAKRKQLASAHATTVIAGGAIRLAACAGAPGDGHVPARPQVNLMLAEAGGGDLRLRTESACDMVLLARGPDGAWAFDDDGSGGTDALLVLSDAPEGRYDIWIGSYGPGSCAARLFLSME